MSPVLAFEVWRFTATPGSSDVAVLALEGRFSAPSRRRLGAPRLLAENAEERLEVGAADGGDATADPDGTRWRGSFAVPLRLLDGGVFALAVGRELLELPAPDRDESVKGAGDLHLRLAREANALRALADEAREAAAAALGRAESERSERERLEAEMRGERHAREELATRLAQFDSELAARDEALERVRREHEDELGRRDAAVQARADERVAEVEAEAVELRRALKSARADVEMLRRERHRAAGRSAVLRAEPATTPIAAEAAVHPEQESARPALPLPEGEEVGTARPTPGASPAANGDRSPDRADDEGDEAPTAVVDPENRSAEEPGHDDPEFGDADGPEGVRLLGRRAPRTRSGDEPPVEPLPGTAAIGARHIVAGDMGRAGLGLWIARAAAMLALAFVVAAVLLVVWGLR